MKEISFYIWNINKHFVSLYHTINNNTMKRNRTHTATGIELSQMFIGEDGTLSTFGSVHELEIVGATLTPFGEAWVAIKK